MITTPLSAIADKQDGEPVMAVSGMVKYASKISKGRSDNGNDWSRQFFVLSGDHAEVGCTLWDAEGNEMKKGEHVLIENTQNKKGQWSAMTKQSYQKEGKTNHTLEIRAEQAKIKPMDQREPQMRPEDDDCSYPPQERKHPLDRPSGLPLQSPHAPATPNTEDVGVIEAKKHLVQSGNLMLLAMNAARWTFMKYQDTHSVDLPVEHFQALCASLFIEASSRRSTDGVTWWSYTDKMPTTPIK